MSKEDYNRLLESEQEINNKNNNQMMNNFENSQQQFHPNNTGSNFNESKKRVRTQNLIENDLNNDLMSSGYKTNYIPNYNRPKTSIKWRNVMKVDLDYIRNTNNLSLLNSYLDNFIYSDITEDDIQAVPEGNIVKLIKILQFSNECLLGIRQNLYDNINNLKDQKQELVNKYQQFEDKLINQKDFLDKSNQERKIRMKEIADYKNMVSALLQGGIPNRNFGINTRTKITDINIDINKYNQSTLKIPTNGFKCKYCTGKTFPSEFELKKHLSDIHLIKNIPDDENVFIQNIPLEIPQQINITMPPINNPNINYQNNNKDEFDKKLNEMKQEFQEYVHRAEVDNLKSQLLRNKNMDMMRNNMNNEGEDYQQQLEKMGKTFNDTLKQFMGVIVKNNNNNNNQEKQVIIKKVKKTRPKRNYEFDIRNDEDIKSLKNEIDNTKKRLESNQKEYDETIISLINETKKITNEINQQKEMIPNIPIPKKTILVTEQKEPISIIKKNVKKKGKITKFHSGPLESDHDDSDNELKRQEKILHKLKDDSNLLNIILKEKTRIIHNIDFIDQPLQDNFGKKLRKINIDQDEIKGEKDLDDFYKRYIKRDNEFIDYSTFDKYLTPVLPNRFSSNNDVKKNAVFNLNNNLTRTANRFYNENTSKIIPKHQIKELIKEDKNDLIELINDSYLRIDKIFNKKNGDIDPYYKSVKTLLNFDNIIDSCKILNNFSKAEIIKNKKLINLNKEDNFINNNINNKIYDINQNNQKKKYFEEEEEDYPESNYFSKGNVFSGQTKINKEEKSFFTNNNNNQESKIDKLNNINTTNLNNNQNQLLNSNKAPEEKTNLNNNTLATQNNNEFQKIEEQKNNNNNILDNNFSSLEAQKTINSRLSNTNNNNVPEGTNFSNTNGKTNINFPIQNNSIIQESKFINSTGGITNNNTRPNPVIDGQNNSNIISTQMNNNEPKPNNNMKEDQKIINTIHGQNQEINNNDSWDKGNPLVESKASIGPGIMNQNNVQIQNIDSKIVVPAK